MLCSRGPSLTGFDRDNMIYAVYKYPSGKGNNVLDDIFQTASGSLARYSPGITGKGKKMWPADLHSILQVVSEPLCADPCFRKRWVSTSHECHNPPAEAQQPLKPTYHRTMLH